MSFLGDTMPDRSSHQGLPDEWNHGSHAARGSFPADGYAAAPAGSHRARTDSIGVRDDTYGTGAADPFGEAGSFGSKNSDPFGPGSTASFSAVGADAGTAHSEAAKRSASAHRDPALGDAGDSKGFLGALFDFGFTSFVTPKVIKVLYMLIVIGTVVSALVVTIVVFKASVMFGFLMLVFGDPLFILIALAIYRVILEFFVVTFRVAEDIRVLRERGSLS
jgi:Domain of unknown function (DUF4282)